MKETEKLAAHLQEAVGGAPWFGRNIFDVLSEVDEKRAFSKPNGKGHSMSELLYHMITWASFAEQRIRKTPEKDTTAFEKLDWRQIDPAVHTWKEGVALLRTTFMNIVELLRSKEDSFLDEKVDYRDYNFDHLIKGVTEHTIYHLGQIAYINKFLG